MARPLIFAAFISILWSVAAQESSRTPGVDHNSSQAGAAAAEAAIKRGVITYVALGGPPPRDWPELTRKAKELYHIDLVSTGCVPTPYECGYSDTVIHYLTQKYGYDPILALHKELSKNVAGGQ
jgi:hypothetical protein